MGKFYVDENNQARISCHKCGINKNLDVTKFKDTHKKLKANVNVERIFGLTWIFEGITVRKSSFLVNALSKRKGKGMIY